MRRHRGDLAYGQLYPTLGQSCTDSLIYYNMGCVHSGFLIESKKLNLADLGERTILDGSGAVIGMNPLQMFST